MKLQLALDGTLKDSLAILEKVHPHIDIAEIGTPLIYREGIHAARQIKQLYPDLSVLADLKIMDAGREEADIAFTAGSEYVTVLAVTQNDTIRGAVTCARHHDRFVMADMMQVKSPVERAKRLLDMGVDVLCVHTAYDVQSRGNTPFAGLKTLREALPNASLAVAGGITLATLDDLLPFSPEIIIVGSGITRADDPAAAAQAIKTCLQTH